MKDKMRCARCGKTFKPARSSQTLCDQCEKQERAARAAARTSASATTARPTSIPPQAVKIVGPAASLLDPTAPASASTSLATNAPPPDTGLYGAAAIREEQRREQQRREQQRREEERARDEQRARERAQRLAEARQASQHDQERHDRAPQASANGSRRGVKPAAGQRPTPAPRATKAPRAPMPHAELTDEVRAKIEARYLELAQPIEFDGIRTRIAAELSVPKSHVKRAVADLRARMQLPSWWELQSYSGAETDLERIRMAYLPHLPVPAVGIHKTLAEELNLDPRTIYQGIRRIRAEMRLPQYNAPELHGGAIASRRGAQAESAEQITDATVSDALESSVSDSTEQA